MERYERALLLHNFKLQNVIHGVAPLSLELSFFVKNLSKEKNYTVLPAQCILRSFYIEIARTIIFPTPSSSFVGEPAMKPVAGTYLASTSSINLPPESSIEFKGVVSLSPWALQSINEELDKYSPGGRDVRMEVMITLPAIEFTKMDESFVYNGCALNGFEFSYKVGELEWIDWLKNWGYQITLIYVPYSISEKLKELTRKMGFLKEWEVISLMLRNLEKITPKFTLLRGTAIEPVLRDRIRQLIENAKKRLYIAVQVIDTELLKEIIDAINRGVDVKIVIAEPDMRWFKYKRDAKALALKELNKLLKIKVKEDLHCRMLVIDERVVIGSMDLDRQGLTVHDNIAIETDDSTLIENAIEEFHKIFQISKDLQIPTNL
jgi:sugar-specific transcriptional regulator TrmB